MENHKQLFFGTFVKKANINIERRTLVGSFLMINDKLLQPII